MSFRYSAPLSETHKRLIEEWDFSKNLLLPHEVTAGSDKKAYWICRRNKNHCWEASISKRALSSRGCPYCSRKKVLLEDSLFSVCTEAMGSWDWEANSIDPRKVAPSSGRRAWWRCSICGWSWDTRINSRVSSAGAIKTGCARCAGAVITPEKSLSCAAPHLLEELCGTVDPALVFSNSHKQYWWRCSRCEYSWKSSVKQRVRQGSGCPRCSGRVVSADNSLAARFPAVACTWSEKNSISSSEVCYGSDKHYWWVCPEGHEWEASPNNRTNTGSGCPECAQSSVSKVSQEWLDSLGIPEEFREYPIKLPGRKRAIKVDGFDPKTCTVYEFLGNFWHGNPDLYAAEDTNPVNKKTFGSLHSQTIRRLERLRKAGYNVVFVWEKDYRK